MYTEKKEEWIHNMIFRGKTGNQKYLQMATYFFELGYKLTLSCKDNVLDSRGFKSFGLIIE